MLMRRSSVLFAAAFLLLALGQQAHGQDQFPWEQYKARTFGEIIKANADEVGGRDASTRDKVSIVFPGDSLPSRVRVMYTGTTRKIPAARKGHIDEWAKSLGVKPEMIALFEDEVLFVECSTEYWLPVQKQVIPYFQKELKKGDMVTLYTAFIGGRKIDGAWNWIFIVNEFQAYR
jgi:hypothetical protein